MNVRLYNLFATSKNNVADSAVWDVEAKKLILHRCLIRNCILQYVVLYILDFHALLV